MDIKRIIVFGATGGTGREVVQQALKNGWAVKAMARTPAALALQHPYLDIVKADVLQPSGLEAEIAGAAAVISCLGTGTGRKPTTLYSAGMTNIVSAMHQAGARRLICFSAGALDTYKEMGVFARAIATFILQPLLKHPFADLRLMESIVERSRLDWTIVRPPRLVNKPLRGKYRVAIGSHLTHPSSIARADLAHYMLGIIDNRQAFQAKAEISY